MQWRGSTGEDSCMAPTPDPWKMAIGDCCSVRLTITSVNESQHFVSLVTDINTSTVMP